MVEWVSKLAAPLRPYAASLLLGAVVLTGCTFLADRQVPPALVSSESPQADTYAGPPSNKLGRASMAAATVAESAVPVAQAAGAVGVPGAAQASDFASGYAAAMQDRIRIAYATGKTEDSGFWIWSNVAAFVAGLASVFGVRRRSQVAADLVNQALHAPPPAPASNVFCNGSACKSAGPASVESTR